MAKIQILNITTLSYSGTTWLNLLLGGHPEALTIGPPQRLWGLREENFSTACLIHGAECPFWPAFGESWDRNENFFVALSEFSGKTVFLFDGASPEFFEQAMEHSDVDVKPGRYVRDGRAITASFARKMKNHGVNYLDSILPNGWFYPSFQATPSLKKLKEEGVLVVHYEDAVNDQEKFLKDAGAYLGLEYGIDTFSFWGKDHHITSGNPGPVAMVRLEQSLSINNFEGAEVYREQLEKLRTDPTDTFKDERWKTQLTREELFWFDQFMGKKNSELGYQRDVFTQEETRTFVSNAMAKEDFVAAIPKDFIETLRAV